jgi:hypothetical protein
MPWLGPNIAWSRRAIIASVPNVSGVYAIWKPLQWIYVGEADDVLRRLLEHFDGDNACINQAIPTGCGFELLQPGARVARQEALIAELGPLCNPLTTEPAR